MPNAYRAFIALPLPRKILDYLTEVQECLAAQGIRARWVRPEAMHLTVKFLGQMESGKTETVSAVLDQVAANYPPLQLTTHGLGGFPNINRPRVLWAGIGGDRTRLMRLQQDVESALVPLGWPREKRPFKGHLTVARTKGRRPFERQISRFIEPCEPEEPLAFVADKLTLYRSRLRPQGAVYDIISERVLSGVAS